MLKCSTNTKPPAPGFLKTNGLPARIGVFLVGFFLLSSFAFSQINLSITKSHNAPTPIASGQPFTYTITYSWSGGAPGTLYIVDNVPGTLDVLSALPGNPVSNISGNVVTFTLSGLTLPSGSGTVQINARFTPGITCGGVRACNKASISTSQNGPFTYSNEVCVTSAQPVNRWTFEKEWIAGCALDDEVIYRIKIMAPAGNDIGGLNLTNVTLQDVVPANAFIPAGGVSVYWTGFSGSSPNYTLTGGPSTLTVTPWPAWYMAYVKVKYPSSFFTVGQQVVNSASIRFNTPCSSQFITLTDTAKTTLCQPISQGSLSKWLSLGLYLPNNPSWYPVWTPGCCGTYRLYYQNTGNVGQPNFVMEDVLPGQVDVNAIHTNVPAGNLPVTVNVYCWSGGSCVATPCTTVVYTTAGYKTITGLPSNICRVTWSYSGSIAITQFLDNYLDVCVRSTNFQNGNAVVVGQNVVNTLNVSATNLSTLTTTQTQAIDQTKPKVLATKLFIGGCNNLCQINPNGPFQPGDIVRFRMAVANIGNANATTCTITDALPAGLSYVGNPTYYYGGFNYMINQWNPPCCSTSVTVPSQIGGTITSPTVGATNLTWTFPVLPSRCDGTVDWLIIDFDVKISDTPPAAPGQYPNTFTIGASNITNVTSNVAYLTVNQTAQLQAIKDVRKMNADGSYGPWASSATMPLGGAGQFRITIKNTGNSQLSNLCLLDIMPYLGDIKVLPPYTPRGSNIDIPYDPINGALNITPGGFSAAYNSAGYNPSKNPLRSTVCGGFCGVADPSGAVAGTFNATAVQTFSFRVSANSGVNLMPGNTLNVEIPFVMPKQAPPQANGCNSFAVQATPVNMTNVCLSAESNNACVVAEPKAPCIRLVEARINCVSKDANGNSVYLLQFNATNLSGTNATVNIIPSAGSIISINPTTLPNNVPTNFNVAYSTNTPGGQVCFTLWLFDQEHMELCDTTFCLDLKPCPDPCPCPFQIKFEKATGYQATGNQAYFTNLISVLSNPVLQIRASVVSATVNQYCKNGSYTTYNSGATFVSTSLNPVLTSGLGTAEVIWTNYNCPQVMNTPFNFYLNIPNAPGKGCYQTIKVCVRYTITDCKCNTCDTLVCYEFARKWIPIWDPVDDFHKDNKGTTSITGKNSKDQTQSEELAFIQMNMTSDTEGKLTFNNPAEDEFTTGINLISINMYASPGIKIVSMTPDKPNWSEGAEEGIGLTSIGELKPGNVLNFNVKFDNPDSFKTWINTLQFGYTIDGVPDTLYGKNQVRSRTPGASGGDELVEDFNVGAYKDGKAFALRFMSNNNSKDSIAKVIIRVKNGNILAVGPQLGQGEATLTGFRTSDGERRLLTASPDHNDAVLEAIPGQHNIGPIFIYAVYEGKEALECDYETYTVYNELVTSGTLRIETPVTSVGDGDVSSTVIYLSDAVPNPALSQSTISFRLKNNEPNVSLVVTDQRGSTVARLIDGESMSSGEHSAILDTRDLPNGVYYFTLSTPTSTQTRKIVVVK